MKMTTILVYIDSVYEGGSVPFDTVKIVFQVSGDEREVAEIKEKIRRAVVEIGKELE